MWERGVRNRRGEKGIGRSQKVLNDFNEFEVYLQGSADLILKAITDQ